MFLHREPMSAQAQEPASGSDPAVIRVELREYRQRRTILLRIGSPIAVGRLTDLFRQLSESRFLELNALGIHPTLFVLPESLEDIIFRTATNETSRTVELRKSKTGQRSMIWTRHTEGWLECAELVVVLSPGGYQYLSRGTSDDAEVLVSFGEVD